MNRRDPLSHSIVLAALLGLASLLGGCGGGGGSGDAKAPIPSLSYTKDYLTYGETLEVVITKPDEGELITNVSEAELGIDIEQQPCDPVNARCVRWLITPTQLAVGGDYRIGVGHRTTTWATTFSHDPADYNEIHFKLLPAQAVSAATSLAVGDKVSVAVTADGEVWAWGDMSRISRVAPVTGKEYPISDRPRSAGISNAAKVYFPRGDASRFYVYKTDGSVDAYLDRGTLSEHDVIRVGPLRNEDGTLATDIREISGDGRALLNNGEVRYLQDNTLFVGLTGYCPLSGGLEGHVVQIDGYSAPAENRPPNLFLRDDGTVVLMNERSPSCGWTQIALTNVIQIQTIFSVGFALRDDGTVWVWDYDDPTRLSQVPGLVDIVEISSGTDIFARDSLGRVFKTYAYWSTSSNSFKFLSVDTMPGVSSATAMASRDGNMLVLLDDCASGGRVLSWGNVIGSGVFDNPEVQPVIGIGEADPSCSRLALFYPSTRLDSPDPEMPFFRVDTDTGNIACSNDLCWEWVPSNSSLLTTTVAIGDNFTVQPKWDCEAAGNNLGQSFTLGIADRDVYCKLVTDAYRFTANVQDPKGGNYYGLVDTVPAGLLSRNANGLWQVAIIDPGTAFRLIPPTLLNLTFIGFSGDCTRDGQVVMPARNAECNAVVQNTSQDTGYYYLSVVIEGGPQAGKVMSSETPQRKIDCRNTSDITTICTAIYPLEAEAEVVLRGIPTDSNSQITWSGCTPGVDAQNQPVCRVSMDAHRVVTASFVPAPPPPAGDYTLSVVIDGGPGIATVRSGETPTPLLDCNIDYQTTTTCTATYSAGSTVALYGEMFSSGVMSWEGCTPGIDDLDRPMCGLTMDADHTVNVHLQPTYILNLTIDGQPRQGTTVFSTGSSVTLYCVSPDATGTTCSVEIPQGDQLLLDWSNPVGYPIQSWTGCTPEQDANNRLVCRLTMDTDYSVTATFGP